MSDDARIAYLISFSGISGFLYVVSGTVVISLGG